MQTVFDATPFRARKRFSAWQDAICEIYAKVNVKQLTDGFYNGQVEQGQFGTVNYTLASGTPNVVSREREHLSFCQNDNIFIQLVQTGQCEVGQRGQSFSDTRGRAIVFTVAEPYTLYYPENYRSLYIEISRHDIEKRTKLENIKCLGGLDLAQGGGRLFYDYCLATYRNYETLSVAERELVGGHLVDLFVLAASNKGSGDHLDVNVRDARRSALRSYIEKNFYRPALSPAMIARENGISLRYLHMLFEDTGETVSELCWSVRLSRSRDLLRSRSYAARSITEIAFSCGFNSSSHFCNVFKRRFGETPSEFRLKAALEELSLVVC